MWRLIIFIIILIFAMIQVFWLLIPLCLYYAWYFDGYELIPLAILIDGYYQAFYTLPVLTLIVSGIVFVLNFLKPKLLLYTK